MVGAAVSSWVEAFAAAFMSAIMAAQPFVRASVSAIMAALTCGIAVASAGVAERGNAGIAPLTTITFNPPTQRLLFATGGCVDNLCSRRKPARPTVIVDS